MTTFVEMVQDSTTIPIYRFDRKFRVIVLSRKEWDRDVPRFSPFLDYIFTRKNQSRFYTGNQ